MRTNYDAMDAQMFAVFEYEDDADNAIWLANATGYDGVRECVNSICLNAQQNGRSIVAFAVPIVYALRSDTMNADDCEGI